MSVAHSSNLGDGEDDLALTERSKLRRRPDRGSRKRTTVHAIIDEALVCHVGFIADGAPVVIPATPWRIGRWLYLHGAANSRLIRHVGGGHPVCVSLALVDGLVFARSAMRHSTDYRSVVLFGQGEAVEAAADKRSALAALIDKLSPGRAAVVRPPDDAELAATGVVRLAIEEGAAKTRNGPPAEVDKDKSWNVWSGTLPVGLRVGSPQPAGEGAAALTPPQLAPWLAADLA